MRSLPTKETDVLVLGHGATGLFAAWELARKGHDVAIIGNGTPASEMSTGCITFPDEEGWQETYGLDGGIIKGSTSDMDRRLQTFLGAGPCAWEGSTTMKRTLLTNIGTTIRVNFAPITSYGHDIQVVRGSNVAVLGVRGHKDLDPELFSIMARKDSGLKAVPTWISPLHEGSRSTRMEMSYGTALAREALLDTLQEMDADMVFLPPMCHPHDHDRAWTDLARDSGRQLIEAVTPLSLPGTRLMASMGRSTFSQRVHDMRGMVLRSLDVADGNVKATCRSGLRTLEVRANALLFCGGHVVSGGLSMEGREAIDPLSFFDIRISSPTSSPLARVARTGLACDASFHAFHRGEVMQNVLVAGSALPGLNFANGHGMGTCLLTALAACRSLEEGI
jgi:anaerobic glycerol-3-phosphate dehydrogenase